MYAEDILEATGKIECYVRGLGYDSFAGKTLVVDAVVRNLEIVGEASRNIPEETRRSYPDIPWKRMIGLRNIVVHEYFGIDLTIVWEIVTRNLPETQPLIAEMLDKLKDT